MTPRSAQQMKYAFKTNKAAKDFMDSFNNRAKANAPQLKKSKKKSKRQLFFEWIKKMFNYGSPKRK